MDKEGDMGGVCGDHMANGLSSGWGSRGTCSGHRCPVAVRLPQPGFGMHLKKLLLKLGQRPGSKQAFPSVAGEASGSGLGLRGETLFLCFPSKNCQGGQVPSLPLPVPIYPGCVPSRG